jgi:peptide/nickel transport system substrate-binding protein
VPASALTTFNRKATFDVVQGRTNRVIYLAFDVASDTARGVDGTDGRNPFKDQRVRHAFSLAIDRQALGERVLSGSGAPTMELVPDGTVGALGLEVPRADILYARALLADAGYPAGFTVILGTPRDRYLQDKEVANAVALMLARIGIRVSVDARSSTEFFDLRGKGEYSFYLAGLGSSMADLSAPLRLLVATPGDGTYGRLNFGGYSNPVLDGLVRRSLAAIGAEKRLPVLREAARIVAEDLPILPLYFEKSSYALRSELDYRPRTDQYLLADDVRYRSSPKLAN